MNNLRNYIGDSYIPSFEDILNCRIRTTGIKKEMFFYNQLLITMFDVGGARSERRKWLTICDNINTVIFMVSIAGIAQVIFEDNKTNRLSEALKTFEKTVNHPNLRYKKVVVLFNKMDIFRNQLLTHSLSDCFGDKCKELNVSDLSIIRRKIYDIDIGHFERIINDLFLKRHKKIRTYCKGIGKDIISIIMEYSMDMFVDSAVEKGIKLITKQFKARYKKDDKSLYFHSITATDTNCVKSTLKMILRDTI